jgi:hypothetical protein
MNSLLKYKCLLTDVAPVTAPPIVPIVYLDFSVISLTTGFYCTELNVSLVVEMTLEPILTVPSAAEFT